MASIFPSPGQNFALLGLSLCLLSQVCPILPSWLTVPSCSISTQQDRLVRSGFGVPGGDGSAHVENNRPAVCFRGIVFSWMRFAFQSVKGLVNLLIQKCGSWFEEGKENPATVVGGRGLSGPGCGLQLRSCWGKLMPVAFLIPCVLRLAGVRGSGDKLGAGCGPGLRSRVERKSGRARWSRHGAPRGPLGP